MVKTWENVYPKYEHVSTNNFDAEITQTSTDEYYQDTLMAPHTYKHMWPAH